MLPGCAWRCSKSLCKNIVCAPFLAPISRDLCAIPLKTSAKRFVILSLKASRDMRIIVAEPFSPSAGSIPDDQALL